MNQAAYDRHFTDALLVRFHQPEGRQRVTSGSICGLLPRSGLLGSR